MSDVVLENLVVALIVAKRNEESAREARIDCEGAIAWRLGAREEGSQTHSVGDYKVTITGKLIRSMDWDAWEREKKGVPEHLHPVKTKTELDVKGVKWLEQNAPDCFQTVSKCITVRPAKVSVNVKKKEK